MSGVRTLREATDALEAHTAALESGRPMPPSLVTLVLVNGAAALAAHGAQPGVVEFGLTLGRFAEAVDRAQFVERMAAVR